MRKPTKCVSKLERILKICKFLLVAGFFLAASLAAANSGITYHGRIIRPDGLTPVTSTTTQFRIQIRTPGTENCLLWEEQQQKDLSGTSGTFSITVADTAEPSIIANTLPYTLERIFSNRTNFTGLTNCSSGATYNPTASDGRNLVVYFRETPTDPWEQMPVTKINFVPIALNSIQLEGYKSAEFLKIDPLSSYTPLTAANVTSLIDIISGATTQYLKPGSAFGGDVSGTYNAISVDKVKGVSVAATAPTAGQVLKYNGTAWAPAADDNNATPPDASYSVKGIVKINTDLATSGLFIAGGVLALPNVITAGGPIGTAQTVPVITYDQKGRLTAVSTATIDDTTKLPLAGGTMTGNLNMGTHDITNAINIAATNTSVRNLFLNDNDTNYITVKSPADITANYTLTLPVNDGAVGEVLATDGNGVLSWVSSSAGSVTSVSSANNYLTVATPTTTPVLTVNVGTVANTVAAGDDARIVNAVQQAAYAADLAPAALCTNVQTPYWNTVSDLWACQNIGTVPNATSAVNFTGALAGDVSGTQSATSVDKIKGKTVSAATAVNQLMIYDGTSWVNNILSGDATLLSTGVLTLKNTGSAGTYYKVTTDAQGRVTSGTNLVNGDITTALGYTPLNKAGDTMSGTLGLFQTAADPSTAGWNATQKGYSWFNTTSNQVKYWDGTTIQSLGVSGAGLTSLGGQSGSSQTFAAGAAGTAPAITSASDVHTLNVPLASGAGVTSGTISKTDYDAFTAKLTSPLTTKGDLLTRDATTHVRLPAGTDGQVLTADSAQTSGLKWNTLSINSLLPSQASNSGKFLTTDGTNVSWSPVTAGTVTSVTSANAYLSVATTTTTPVITANVGTAANTLAAGDDARITGALQTTTYDADVLPAASCTTSQTPYWNGVAGTWACQNINVSSAGGFFKDGGNSFGANASIGTNDNFNLNIKTNNTTKMTVQAAGNVGIGTTSPNTILDINGAVSHRGVAAPILAPAGQGRIYFDSTSNTYKVSQNGGAFVDLVSTASGTVSGTTGNIAKFTSGTAVGDSILSESGTTITLAGSLALPTTSSTVGQITLNGTPILHGYGSQNIFLGASSGNFTLTGNKNVGLGYQTLTNVTGASQNTAVGHSSMMSITGVSGWNNASLGFETLKSTTTGSENTAVGSQALLTNTTGSYNTAVGREALKLSVNNVYNTALGHQSLFTSTGSYNTGIGAGSLTSATTATNNTASGALALNGNTTGSDNTVVGYRAGVTDILANKNVTGSQNTYIGSDSGPGSATQLTNATAIGYLAKVTASNAMVLGNSSVSVGIGTTAPATKLDVAGGVRIGTEATACAAGLAGTIRYNSGNVEYCNGSSWQAFGVSGAGITSLGGQTGATQTFANGSTGTAPAFSSATNVHTLNIPLASGAGVTSGTISKTDYDAFTAKLTSPLTTKGDILAFSTMNTRLPVGTDGQVLQADSTQTTGLKWATPTAGTVTSVTSANSYLSVATTTTTPVITANVGTTANTLAAGDDPRIVGAFVDGGNTKTATATLGTNSNHDLEIETNGTTKMTVKANGLVGIGTTTPTYKLDSVDNTAAAIRAHRNDSANTRTPALLVSRSRADATAPDVGFGVSIDFQMEGFTNGSMPSAAQIETQWNNTQTNDTTSRNSNLIFRTMYQGALNDTIRIAPNGAVGINTYPLTNNNLDVNGGSAFGSYAGINAAPTNGIIVSGNVGIGTTSPATKLDIAGGVRIGAEATACAAGLSGTLRYNGGSVEYCNGSSWQAFGVSGAGLTSLNAQTGSTQTFANGATGTAPAFSSATNVHTLNIPLASGAGVTSGTISKTDYDKFNAGGTMATSGTSGGIPYYNSATTVASSGVLAANGVVLGGGAGTTPTTTAAGTANQVLRVPNAGGAPAFGLIDLTTSMTGVLPITNGGTNSSTALTNGKVMVSSAGKIIEGNASNTAKSNNTFVMRDGSGNIAGALGTYDQLALNGTVAGTLNIYPPSSFTNWNMTLPTTAGTSGQVLSTNGSGVTSWVTALTSSTGFLNGGNSFGAAASLGTNDNFDLNIETNSTTKMTIQAGGNVGIGTTSPIHALEVVDDGNDGLFKVTEFSNTYSADARIYRARGTKAGPSALLSGDIIGGLNLFGYGSSSVPSSRSVGIEAVATENYTATARGAALTFKVAANGTTTSLEAMRVDQNGYVGIGTSAPVWPLDVQGTVAPLRAHRKSTLSNSYNVALILDSENTSGAGGLSKTGMAFDGESSTTLGRNMGYIYSLWTDATDATRSTAFSFETVLNGVANERMRIDSVGNVGINTVSPNTALDISGAESHRGMAAPAVSPAGQGRIYFDSTSNTYKVSQNGGAYANLVGSGSSALSSLTAATATNTIDNLLNAQTWNWSTATTQSPLSISANALTTGSLLKLTSSSASLNSTNGLLNVANTSAATTGVIARIQSNSTAGSGLTVWAGGNVGIGTTSPDALLDMMAPTGIINDNMATVTYPGSATAHYPSFLAQNFMSTAATGNPEFVLVNSRGTWAAPSPILSGDTIGDLEFAGATDTISNWKGAAAIEGQAEGNFSSTSAPGALAFYTVPSGSTVKIARMRINSAGNIGIGTNSPTTGTRLDITGTGAAASSIIIPRDTVANRPTTGVNGMLRYASDTNKFEGYQNGAWTDLIGSSSGDFKSDGTVSMTGILKAASGTAALPGITFASDTGLNTGLFLVGQDSVGFSAAGTERMEINANSLIGSSIRDYSFMTRADISSSPRFVFVGSNDLSILGGNEATDVLFNLSQTRQHAAGAISLQRDFRIVPSSHSFVSASTITDAAGLAIDSPPSGGTNATVTNSHGILVTTGTSLFGVTNSYGITVNAPNGATNNYAAAFLGGNVGIGTTAPVSGLNVVSQSSVPTYTGVVSDQYSTDNWGAQFAGRKARGTLAAPTAVANGDWITAWHSKAWDGSSWIDGGYMAFVSNGTVSAGSVPTDFFVTTGSSGMGTERLRILSTGNVGIGVSAPQAALDVVSAGTSSAVIVPRATTGNRPTTLVNGMIRYNSTTNLFEFYQNGGWVNYTTVSDGRLKTNVVPVNQGLEIVNHLNPVFFDWDQNNPRAQSFGTQHQVGFIAQEVEKVLPEVVNKGEDSYRSVEYGKIVSVVVAAVKELYVKVMGIAAQNENQDRQIASKADQTEVEQLKAQNAAQDKKIKELEQRLERIEKSLNSK